ncbi:unnamed protein product [Acanthoscelides obtectus]|uniref:Uncharacterized protein n=1 Tax=Acanthoscelides obtectus TaxID=200917 RepID=A0A9P0NVN0_ACAOB|nr:unnamed protein product [Acanthoscelides obtectus]CAK1640277.1 hypothetical protein AOBTE_LOCUS11634 [Acanthoscelides obtectus]
MRSTPIRKLRKQQLCRKSNFDNESQKNNCNIYFFFILQLPRRPKA